MAIYGFPCRAVEGITFKILFDFYLNYVHGIIVLNIKNVICSSKGNLRLRMPRYKIYMSKTIIYINRSKNKSLTPPH